MLMNSVDWDVFDDTGCGVLDHGCGVWCVVCDEGIAWLLSSIWGFLLLYI